jgi:hypothetical protein
MPALQDPKGNVNSAERMGQQAPNAQKNCVCFGGQIYRVTYQSQYVVFFFGKKLFKRRQKKHDLLIFAISD